MANDKPAVKIVSARIRQRKGLDEYAASAGDGPICPRCRSAAYAPVPAKGQVAKKCRRCGYETQRDLDACC